jgi:hypothetical protein
MQVEGQVEGEWKLIWGRRDSKDGVENLKIVGFETKCDGSVKAA